MDLSLTAAETLIGSNAASAACVELTDVCLGIDGHDVIRNLSFSTVSARIGIVGRNGSGKSTLARLVAGLVAPATGTVRINGKDLAKDRRAALSEVGILFQNPDHQIIFPMVCEELAFGLRQMGVSKSEAMTKVKSVLVKFGVEHWHDARVESLSAGQKHLVCLMSVVAMAPRIVLLDEPFAGLDVPTKMQLERYLAAYDGAVLHISHDPRDINAYEQIIWIDHGAVRDQGLPERILPAYLAEMKSLGECNDIAELSS